MEVAQTESNTITYVIQYDGLQLGEHSIDLADLGESLQGFSKILACAGHFVQTGQFNRRYSSLNVSVSTSAQLEAGCIEIPIWIQSSTDLLFSGFAGSVLTAVVAYILSRRGKEEMQHLSDALKESLSQNAELQKSLLATIDKMADGLVAANRQALAPVGRSCSKVSLLDGTKEKEFVTVDEELKKQIDRAKSPEITEVAEYRGNISELDKLTGACKVSLDEDGDDARINGVITDPLLSVPGNLYLQAFANGDTLKFRAKAQLADNGEITKLYISDIVK